MFILHFLSCSVLWILWVLIFIKSCPIWFGSEGSSENYFENKKRRIILQWEKRRIRRIRRGLRRVKQTVGVLHKRSNCWGEPTSIFPLTTNTQCWGAGKRDENVKKYIFLDMRCNCWGEFLSFLWQHRENIELRHLLRKSFNKSRNIFLFDILEC